MSLEIQVQAILANQATILSNQAATLTAIQGITGVDTAGITMVLTQIEGQVAAIQAQVTDTTTVVAATGSATGTAS